MAAIDPIFGTVKVQRNHPDRPTASMIPFVTGNAPGWPTSDHNAEAQHFRSWTYISVHAVAKQCAQATVCVYDNLRTKGFQAPDTPSLQRKHNPKHPIAKLLRRPNPVTSGAKFLYQLEQQIRLTGGFAVWEVASRVEGIPAQLWVIPRGWLWYWPPSPEYPNGVYRITPAISPVWGQYSMNFASSFLVDARELIIDGWPDPSYLGEYRSPLDACSQLIDISEQTDVATLARFKNEVKPGILFSVDPHVEMTEAQIDQLINTLQTYKAGADNVGKSLVVQGVTPNQIGSGSSELDYTQGRGQNRDNVMAIQHTPGIAVGIDTDSTYSGSAVKMKQWVELGFQPDLNLIAQSFTHRWQPVFGDDFCIEINAKNYDDPTLDGQRSDRLFAGIEKGAVSVNEWRASMNLPPIPDGDKYQAAQQQQSPMAGMAGLGSDEEPFDLSEFDLEDDEPDEDGSGQKNPQMQAATGDRKPYQREA